MCEREVETGSEDADRLDVETVIRADAMPHMRNRHCPSILPSDGGDRVRQTGAVRATRTGDKQMRGTAHGNR